MLAPQGLTPLLSKIWMRCSNRCMGARILHRLQERSDGLREADLEDSELEGCREKIHECDKEMISIIEIIIGID